MNEVGGSEIRDYLIKKFNAEEAGGAVNAFYNGKRITLARLESDGKYHMTMAGIYIDGQTQSVTVDVLGPDEQIDDVRVELNDTVEMTTTVQAKPKRGVRRPKVEQLEI